MHVMENSVCHVWPTTDTDMMQVRTLWISDVHLGSRSCQATALLSFLEKIECERLYLVGDIVDMLAMRRSVYWPNSHTLILHRLLEFVRNGAEVIYIPGNHDDPFRNFVGSSFHDVLIKRRAIHETLQGKRLLVIHGDEMDVRIRCRTWLRHAGNLGYCLLMGLHRNVTKLRARLGMPYWSLAAEVKKRVGRAMEFTEAYEHGIVDLARRANADGVVCGHIHHAAFKEIDGLMYCNEGDWVESCTAFAEHIDGELELLRWADIQETSATGVSAPFRKRAA